MHRANPKVDAYLRRAKKWRPEMQELRRILLDTELTEELKWRAPCYTHAGRNIVLFGGFKDYCMLNFIKGALLKDARRVLLKPGENTQVSRVIRFTSVPDVVALEPILRAYVREAIEVEKSGLKVKLKKITERKAPAELDAAFAASPALKTAFRALTPGRQRAYLLHFSAAKQSQTRESRIEKCRRRILQGKGLNDE